MSELNGNVYESDGMKKWLSDDELYAARQLYSFVDWFAPSKEACDELKNCILELAVSSKYYRKALKTGKIIGRTERLEN